MPESIALEDLRRNIGHIADQLSDRPESGAVKVTVAGKPVLALMSWQLYEAILETLDVMSDMDLVGTIKRGIAEIREGKGIPWAEANRELQSLQSEE